MLLARGRSWPGIEEMLLKTLTPALRLRVTVVPEVEAGVYASLVDMSDVFISGDTGPVHIAAARKQCRDGKARNRVAVVTVVGSTDPQTYCYDSLQKGYIRAAQGAPSRCFAAAAPCRNITCLNKYGKSCRTVRCFLKLDTAPVEAFVQKHLASLREKEPMLRLESA